MIESAVAKQVLFTIGHSNHELPEFVSLLKLHGVTAIADVRSQPYSRFHSQFNRETLADALKRGGVHYVYLGRELGARRTEPESYRENQARYELVTELPAFREGLERLRRGLAMHRIALMCAEKDPITCHRTILVCRRLRSEAITIRHILEDGAIETNEEAESRLLDAVGLPPASLFNERSELIEQAYDLQGERIAYMEPESPSTDDGEKL